MSDSVTFLKLVTGNRLGMYMGLKMDEGKAYRFAKDYTYVEIPVGRIFNPTSEEFVTKVTANQKVQIIPACSINLKGSGYKIMVKTNPKLQAIANCPSVIMLDYDEGDQCSFFAHFQKALNVEDLDWAVRLYLMG